MADSPSGTSVPPADSITIGSDVWSLSEVKGQNGNLILLNGSNEAAKFGQAIVIRVRDGQFEAWNNLGNRWLWLESNWVLSTDPVPHSDPGTTIPPASEIDDTRGNVWTLGDSGQYGKQVLRNGVQVGGGQADQLMLTTVANDIKAFNNIQEWYIWNYTDEVWVISTPG